MKYNNTYKIIKNVHNSGDTALDITLNNTYEYFKAVHNETDNALNVNVINGDIYWLSTSGGTINGDVIINGDLTSINYSSTTINTETILIEDNVLVLNNGEVGTGVSEGTSGIIIDRGLVPDAYFLFDESDDTFHYGISGGTDYYLGNQNYVSKSGDTITGDLTVTGDIHYTKSSAQISSLSGFSATLTNADQYYTLLNIDLSGETLHNFIYSGETGEIIFDNGVISERILFAGSADIEVDTISTIVTFAIFINDVELLRGRTPTDFTSLDRLKNISINRILVLNNGDKVTVRVKSDVPGTVLTIASINLSFWG